MNKHVLLYNFSRLSVLLCIFAMVVSGCGKTDELPVKKIQQTLKDVADYSIILEDMKEEGNFFKTYFHKYRVVQNEEAWTTDWLEVPESYYKTNENFIGMSLVTRRDGDVSNYVSPPGYQYVGDSRYGHWRTDSHGSSFWEWYGKYALVSSLFGGWYRPIYMHDYDAYRGYRSSGRPYYGKNNMYGTRGSIVKKAKPNFYSRHMAKQGSRRASFSNKVSKRVGRTRTSYRSRSGGFGK